MSRKPFLAGNFKMFKTVSQTRDYTHGLKKTVGNRTDRDIVLCPPFTSLPVLQEILADSSIQWGAQNMHFESEGAFTGEIAAPMLVELGCSYVILGHSERRHKIGEDDALIFSTVVSALQHHLVPIICVGETESDRKMSLTEQIVGTQTRKIFEQLNEEQAKKCIIAYEPVWAIGTGNTATPEDAQSVHAFIRNQLAQWYNQALADEIRILYGGSVKPNNVNGLMEKPDIDGALVGGACLEVDSFSQIINFEA